MGGSLWASDLLAVGVSVVVILVAIAIGVGLSIWIDKARKG